MVLRLFNLINLQLYILGQCIKVLPELTATISKFDTHSLTVFRNNSSRKTWDSFSTIPVENISQNFLFNSREKFAIFKRFA